MKVTVLSGSIRDDDVEVALVCDGLVALETTRSEAEEIYRRMHDALNINPSAEDGLCLNHLSAKSSDGGWTPYLAYSISAGPRDIQAWNRAVSKAVDQWEAAGFLDKYVATLEDIS